MANESILPGELRIAAQSLEERFQLLRVRSRKILNSEWDSLPTGIKNTIPEWIVTLLASYSLADGVLEYRDSQQPYVRQFSFCNPDELLADMSAGSLYGRLSGYGFVPIAYESDGSMWVTRIGGGPTGAIHLLDHSGWDGNEPTARNGLVFASSRLSLLLASMGVSEVSYYERPEGITSLIWHKET